MQSELQALIKHAEAYLVGGCRNLERAPANHPGFNLFGMDPNSKQQPIT